MFNLPLFRTWSHLINMQIIFFLAVFATFWFEIGAQAGPSLIEIAAGAFLTGAVTLVGGTFVVQRARSIFGLMQTGRWVQYLLFWFAAIAGLELSVWVLPTVIEVSNLALAAAAVVYLGFASAIFVGEVPTQGRSWMPMKMPKQ